MTNGEDCDGDVQQYGIVMNQDVHRTHGCIAGRGTYFYIAVLHKFTTHNTDDRNIVRKSKPGQKFFIQFYCAPSQLLPGISLIQDPRLPPPPPVT